MNQPMSTQNPPDGDAAVPGPVLIFDTTLRDGEQAPGFSLDLAAKLRMAHMLEELGVDIIEAGFPQASPDDFNAVAAVAREVTRPVVCALARCQRGDIERAARALEPARKARLHLFLSTSPLHREFKLGMTKDQVLDAAVRSVEYARSLYDDVEFSAEDASRTEPGFLAEVFSAAAAAGATTLNAPDTVGYATPGEMAELFTRLRRDVRGAAGVTFSGHCHDDLGMAVANSLAAVGAGARQIECTINGIGERAGNAALEEIVMALRVRAPYFGVDTRIDATRLYPASRLLTELTGQAVPRNKAIVGQNAFAHEAGIHQHGMLKHRGTYEIMRPQDVGIAATSLVLGKHSGRHALRERLNALGHTLDDAALDGIFARFKALADQGHPIHDDDLHALAHGLDPAHAQAGPWTIVQLNTSSHLGGGSSASVKLKHEDGHMGAEAAIGEGPVDAVLRAMARATGIELELASFRIPEVAGNSATRGSAELSARHAGSIWHGQGSSTDIVEAAALATLAVVNRIERMAPRAAHPHAAGVQHA